MTDLFSAYAGEVLSVSYATDAFLRAHFPEVDASSSYRTADAYLLQCPKSKRPRNPRRFLINWFGSEKICTLKNAAAWQRKDEAVRRELAAGRYSYDTAPKEK